ncbi:hypothetical protein HanIR_Chr09g0407931 [Helianthus annuus]|nr:hypothetical protein HanIR_Chr09g0407931 [Helianthus annuus]
MQCFYTRTGRSDQYNWDPLALLGRFTTSGRFSIRPEVRPVTGGSAGSLVTGQTGLLTKRSGGWLDLRGIMRFGRDSNSKHNEHSQF